MFKFFNKFKKKIVKNKNIDNNNFNNNDKDNSIINSIKSRITIKPIKINPIKINPISVLIISAILIVGLSYIIIKYLYNIFNDYSYGADRKILKINNSIFFGTKYLPFLALQDAETENYMCFYNRYLYKFYKSMINNDYIKTNIKYTSSDKDLNETCEINSDCSGYNYNSQNNDKMNNIICCKRDTNENRKCSYIKDCIDQVECRKNSDCINNGYVYNLMRDKNDYKNKEICCNNKCIGDQLYDIINDEVICNTEDNKKMIQDNIDEETDSNTIFKNRWTYNQINSKSKDYHSYSFWIYPINNISNLDTYFKTKFSELTNFIKEHNMDNYFKNDIYNINHVERLIFSRGNEKYGYPSVYIKDNKINIYYGSKNVIATLLININKWVNITITLNKNIMSIYNDGLLEHIIKLENPKITKNMNLYLLYTEDKSGENGENGEIQGFSGFLNYFNYYNRTLKPQIVKKIYNNYLNNHINNLSYQVNKFITNKNKNIKDKNIENNKDN